MSAAIATDGTEIFYEARGSGPAVLLVPYWSYHPSLWGPLSAELASDHTLIRYDDRGTGCSGPAETYDVETDTADMEAVLEAADAGPAIAVCIVDGSNRAARVAARREDLVSHVVCIGGAPFGRDALAGEESLISSDVVVGAFLQQLEADYRGAVRGVVEAANMQMTQDELRERVQAQIEHVPREAAIARVQTWSQDHGAVEPGRAIADRLVVLLSENLGGGWFPSSAAMKRAITAHFPGARTEMVDDGIVSRPDQTAAAIRRLTAEVPGVADAANPDVESPA